jgi:hypothetical protein
VLPLSFRMFDDESPVGEVKLAREAPRIGEGITLEPLATGDQPRRFRVHDIDRGYVQATPKSPAHKESTVVVYLIDANDPRREAP